MKKGRIKYCIVIFWTITTFIFAQDLPFESSIVNSDFTDKFIIYGPVELDSIPLTDKDYIIAYKGDSVIGFTKYRSDTTNVMETAEPDNRNGEIKYRFYRAGKDSCYISVDSASVYENSVWQDGKSTLEITGMMANTSDVIYPKLTLCSSETEVQPYITGINNSIRFSSSQGLDIDTNGVINPSNSTPGSHWIRFSSDFCLRTESIELEIIEPEAYSPELEINVCEGESAEAKLSEIADEYTIVDSSYIILSDNLNPEISGYEIVNMDSRGCEVSQSVYVNYIKPEPIIDRYNYLCDKTLVAVTLDEEQDITWNLPVSTDNIFEITGDSSFVVTLRDKNNCISQKTINADVRKFEVHDISYDIIERSCWDFGKININDLVSDYGIGPYSYILKNKLNDSSQDISQVIEGIYNLIIKDSRGCEYVYPDEIAVMKDCLDDFPVFAPFSSIGNNLTVSDMESFTGKRTYVSMEFFIPYEGNIEVYDRYGRKVAEMKAPVYWDGKGLNDQVLPMGNYIMITDKGKVRNITIVR